MVRRTKEDAAATREALIDAAEACFAERGVAGTPLESVAKHAGLTRGALYWHFKSKGELVAAMIERERLPLAASMQAVLAGDAALPAAARVEALRSHMRHVLREAAKNPRLRRVLTIATLRSEHVGEAAEVLAYRRRSMAETVRTLQRFFTLAPVKASLRAGITPAQAAKCVHAAIHGALSQHIIEPTLFNLERDGVALFDAVLQGLMNSPATDQR